MKIIEKKCGFNCTNRKLMGNSIGPARGIVPLRRISLKSNVLSATLVDAIE